jgi:hypothetical protein
MVTKEAEMRLSPKIIAEAVTTGCCGITLLLNTEAWALVSSRFQ